MISFTRAVVQPPPPPPTDWQFIISSMTHKLVWLQNQNQSFLVCRCPHCSSRPMSAETFGSSRLNQSVGATCGMCHCLSACKSLSLVSFFFFSFLLGPLPICIPFFSSGGPRGPWGRLNSAHSARRASRASDCCSPHSPPGGL